LIFARLHFESFTDPLCLLLPQMFGKDTVLITGVSGYVGSWCMQKCLEANYKVIGTVRDPDSKKCDFLKEAIAGKSSKVTGKASESLTLVKADLLDGEAAWDKVFQDHPDIKYVMHTASPFFAKEPKNPEDMLKPAIEGTTNVVNAAVSARVKRIVVTSSVAAIMDPIIDGKNYTAQDWSDPELQSTYSKSKTLAEKKARECVGGSGTELCTVNPSFVLGPTLYSDSSLISGFESGNVVTKMVTGNMGAVPKMWFGVCDVRDVAEAHLRALTTGPPGGRYMVSNKNMIMKSLQGQFATLAGVKPASEVPSCCFSCLALFLPEAKGLKKALDKKWDVDASETNKVLEFQFIEEGTTIKDMVEDFKQLGITKK
jgi:dihydroflavonol-4-reductase